MLVCSLYNIFSNVPNVITILDYIKNCFVYQSYQLRLFEPEICRKKKTGKRNNEIIKKENTSKVKMKNYKGNWSNSWSTRKHFCVMQRWAQKDQIKSFRIIYWRTVLAMIRDVQRLTKTDVPQSEIRLVLVQRWLVNKFHTMSLKFGTLTDLYEALSLFY